MRVQIVKTGEVRNVESAYGVRLIEQGKAVIASEPVPVKQEKKIETKAAGGK